MSRGATRAFDREVRGARIIFGVGSVAGTRASARALGATRVLLLCTPGRKREGARLARSLGDLAVGVFDGAVPHVPETAVRAALARCEGEDVDAVLTFGGGSAIGLGKAVALERQVAIIAVPTTYSGSEMTHIWGVRRGPAKVTGRDERVRPRLVVYDPQLTLALPLQVTVPSLFNALAHAAEALYARGVAPAIADAAEEAIAAMASALKALPVSPRDLDGRADALYGAHQAGACLDAAAMGLHHKLAHVLGGRFDLPHAETHTVLLPHVLAYNAEAAPEALARIARALGAQAAPAALWDLAVEANGPIRLADLGLRRSDIPVAARAATEQAYPNPREVTVEGVEALLEAAFEGRRPG